MKVYVSDDNVMRWSEVCETLKELLHWKQIKYVMGETVCFVAANGKTYHMKTDGIVLNRLNRKVDEVDICEEIGVPDLVWCSEDNGSPVALFN